MNDANEWTLLKHDILPPEGLEFMESSNGTLPEVNNMMMDPFLGSVTYLETHSPPPPPLIGPPPAAVHGKKRMNRGVAKSDRPNARKRTNPEQALILETSFKKNPKPDKEGREELAMQTGLPSRNVQIWFQNRRAKARSVQEAMRKPPRQDDADSLQPFPSQYHQNGLFGNPATPSRNSPQFPTLGDPFTPPMRYTPQQQPRSSVRQNFPLCGSYGMPISPQFQANSNGLNLFYSNITGIPYPSSDYYLTPEILSTGFEMSPQADIYDSDYHDESIIATPQSSSLVSPNFSPYATQPNSGGYYTGLPSGLGPGISSLAPSPCFDKFPHHHHHPNSTPRLLQRRRPQYVMNDINIATSKLLRGLQNSGQHVKSASATEFPFHASPNLALQQQQLRQQQQWAGPIRAPPPATELHRSFSTSGMPDSYSLSRAARMFDEEAEPQDDEDSRNRTVSSTSLTSSNESNDTVESFDTEASSLEKESDSELKSLIPVRINDGDDAQDTDLAGQLVHVDAMGDAKALQEIDDFLSTNTTTTATNSIHEDQW
ncbi:hypothetical protein AWJ20_1926 [Sugiyamaella lignohabitans]|uniref:Homeobox domain-containing protein n=1 Tax=Sugiyamaella lignohabitans TaxID=796027 RepID=A0A161HKN7_9ASCO|nr:uncharacterized protein AWJ20_1926 [Sugiyamaella lignohabitans]ANB13627.1 hypothetical protein AWJ20_1926 [Sugiyamaella lignohabitans]